jgi:septum formation protein
MPLKEIILASSSPRRKRLMRKIVPAGQIVVVESDICEEPKPGEKAEAYCRRVAEEKLMSAWKNYSGPKRLIVAVIGADTVIQFRNEIIGQPKDPDDAVHILKRLAGQSHKVITAVSVLFPVSNRRITFTVASKVWMRGVSDKMIKDYVATGEPLDKAGAYGIQGWGRKLVARYEGSYTNIVGLPIEELKAILADESSCSMCM